MKVGITYTLQPARADAVRSALREEASRLFAEVNATIGEDAKAEYVYLLGDERNARDLVWYVLHFTAQTGPDASNWTLVG